MLTITFDRAALPPRDAQIVGALIAIAVMSLESSALAAGRMGVVTANAVGAALGGNRSPSAEVDEKELWKAVDEDDLRRLRYVSKLMSGYFPDLYFQIVDVP